MGLAAGRIAQDDPEFVRDHLRRLLWLISEESGGQCWRAPEAMAEIVFRSPEPGILWAIGRLGDLASDHVPEVFDAIKSALDDSDPQARGMAVWCLGQLGHTRVLAARPELLADEGPVHLYEDGFLNRVTVGELVRRVRF
jgi:hypothetical protein